MGTLPPFSPILNRLLADFAREDVSFIRISELIEKDTVLAGNVLRLVNSALYGRRATVNSVRHAVALLGVNKLRNATLGMSVTRMWSHVHAPPGWSMARFNLHAVATAMLTDTMAQAGPVDYAEGAFAAGLFHDLGALLIAIALPDEHEEIMRLSSGIESARSETEKDVLGFTHAELSADALTQWNLPEPIRTAVLYHHSPDLAPRVKDGVSLSRAVAAADAYVNAIGYPLADHPGQSTYEAENILQALGLRQPLPVLLDNFLTEFEGVRTMF